MSWGMRGFRALDEACRAWIQVICQLSPSMVFSWSNMGLSTPCFMPLAPAASSLTRCVETLTASSPTCGLPLNFYVDEPVGGLRVAVYIQGSVKLSRETGR